MLIKCPSRCKTRPNHTNIVRVGRFYRKSDRKWVQRFKCALCAKHFSAATHQPCYRQNKRHLNSKVLKLLVSGVSLRRTAMILGIHQITVARKLRFLGLRARLLNHRDRISHRMVSEMQFDDMETIEHTKLKPLSITLAVEKHSRHILGFEVSRMPAKGLLAQRSVKKYGPRKDERRSARDRLFRRIKSGIAKNALIESDANPFYPKSVKEHLPDAHHLTYLGARGAITGQGELKKLEHDPLFSLNHTCAMFRANVNRLFRKTWCTTKKIQPLIDHLEIYAFFHNRYLI